jgi:hypothetical protein
LGAFPKLCQKSEYLREEELFVKTCRLPFQKKEKPFYYIQTVPIRKKESFLLMRAPRVFKLLPKAFLYSDSAFIIDNSNEAVVILKKNPESYIQKQNFHL